ncbi:hypothetical protein FA95DRAFT_1205055 [Auriscalpium vulgare]|uniref:Uncharacterized protein n=1 Tax=Auriscalpium vulgare TaxID=40419 RepID=A0ACB8RTY2_9AGAM|nr:hypothetical protein FA95DRAFT_1205055 [Auriscalpium vulgare]
MRHCCRCRDGCRGQKHGETGACETASRPETPPPRPLCFSLRSSQFVSIWTCILHVASRAIDVVITISKRSDLAAQSIGCFLPCASDTQVHTNDTIVILCAVYRALGSIQRVQNILQPARRVSVLAISPARRAGAVSCTPKTSTCRQRTATGPHGLRRRAGFFVNRRGAPPAHRREETKSAAVCQGSGNTARSVRVTYVCSFVVIFKNTQLCRASTWCLPRADVRCRVR